MRLGGLPVVWVLACLPAGAALGHGAQVRCLTTGPAGAMLCDVLTRTVQQVAEPAILTLKAEDLAPNHLRATLTVLRDGHSWSRGPADLTIMDRVSIPPTSIESFAASLLKGAGL